MSEVAKARDEPRAGANGPGARAGYEPGGDEREPSQPPSSEAEANVAGEVIEAADSGLTDAERERRDRALAEVRRFGDPVLRSRASEVSDFGPELEREAKRMVGLMRGAMGVGLAATQLGVMHRLLVFQAALDATPTAIANPVIEWLSGELATAEEGCLSLPGIGVDVERPLHARIHAVDLRGEPVLLEASGLEARVLQHEIDHLDGVLILDRTVRAQRKAALRALREGTAYSPPRDEDEGEG
jgi:peptide deformylase